MIAYLKLYFHNLSMYVGLIMHRKIMQVETIYNVMSFWRDELVLIGAAIQNVFYLRSQRPCRKKKEKTCVKVSIYERPRRQVTHIIKIYYQPILMSKLGNYTKRFPLVTSGFVAQIKVGRICLIS